MFYFFALNQQCSFNIEFDNSFSYFDNNAIQSHPDHFTAANTKYEVDLRSTHDQLGDKNEIEELIIALIAKENLPIRIVESKYFTALLQGNSNTNPYFPMNFSSVVFFLSHVLCDF